MKACTLIVGLLCSLPGWSTTLITSYPATGPFSGNSICSRSTCPAGVDVAAGFQMPGGSAYVLDSAMLRITVGGANPLSPSNYLLQLFGSDNSGNPSASAFTPIAFNQTNPAGGFTGTTDVTLTPASPFTLQASQIYWLVLKGIGPDPNGGIGFVWVTGSVNPAGIATDKGTRIESVTPPTAPGASGLIYQVNGTLVRQGAVPEPGTLGPVMLGMAGLALLVRRFRAAV